MTDKPTLILGHYKQGRFLPYAPDGVIIDMRNAGHSCDPPLHAGPMILIHGDNETPSVVKCFLCVRTLEVLDPDGYDGKGMK